MKIIIELFIFLLFSIPGYANETCLDKVQQGWIYTSSSYAGTLYVSGNTATATLVSTIKIGNTLIRTFMVETDALCSKMTLINTRTGGKLTFSLSGETVDFYGIPWITHGDFCKIVIERAVVWQ